MIKQWKRLAALSSAIVMAAATLTYFPNDTLQNIPWKITANAETTTEPQVWIEDNLTWTLDADGTLNISGMGAMKDYDYDSNPSPVYHNSKVKKIVIEDGVTSIGEWAFYSSGLNSVTIPDSVTSIGSHAFYDCSSLTSITIPDSVTSIGYKAFENCSSLTSITIPKSVTSIGSGVFNNCNNLTIYLENGSTLTSNDLGVDESKIVSYSQWNEDNLTWKLDAKGTLTISGAGAMKDYDNGDNRSPVHQNSNVKKVVIEDGVTSIGNYAFYKCTGLTNITIPNSVTSIGSYAFDSCSNLTSITIPDSVISIGNAAFSYTGLKSITIPGSVTSIGSSVFWYCRSLTSITIPDSVTSIGKNAFCGCGLTSITIPKSVTSIGYAAFYDCRSLTSITIPDSVTSIGDYAFYNCTSLPSITLPDNVNSIGNSAFSYCRSLTSITIPDSVTSIGIEVFQKCTSLKTISLSCKSTLKRSDFGEQADLVSYTLHTLKKTEAKTVTCTEDGNKEYWTCEHCGKYFLSDDANPATATAVELSETVIPALNHKNAITSYGASKPTETAPGYSGDLYCPDCDTVLEKGYTYWNEGNLTWKLYEDGTLNISGTGAMKNYYDNKKSPVYNNSNVKKVVIEDGVTSIGNYAFTYCVSLTSITIPDSVTSIGYYAFFYCKSLTSITISDSVTSIGNYAFFYCRSLTSITIPDSVTSIGNDAFSNCRSLTSITIPDSVTSIGNDAFYGCSSLQTISLSCKSSLKKSNFGKQANLVSYTLHTLKKTAAKDATCSESGNKEYWTCEHCKQYFLSDDANPETAKAVELSETVIPASHKLTKVEAKDATCTEDGNKEYWTCEHCGKYFLSDDTNPETAKAVEQAETIIPASHKLTKVEAKDATCAENGNKAYWTCEHCKKYFLSDDTNPETAKAVELSETILPAIQHKNAELRNASEPTETSPGYSGDLYCPDCDKVVEKGYTYWNEDNLTWKLDADGTLTISGTGAMKDYNADDNPSPVYKNSNVKKIVIENSVTSIGELAFYKCSSLTNITIPGNVESIGESAFYSCDNLTDVTLQDGVKSIGNAAFIWCNNLTNIVLPNSVTSIGYFAFKDCTSLTSIKIPDSVTSIGSSAFENCSSLTSITIPDSVTVIAGSAFENCSSLTSITIPDSVTVIGRSAFANCSSLKTISLSCKSSLKKDDFGEQADLVSYTNQHLLTKTAAKAATCSESGNKEYWTCEHCGKYFLSDDANPETAKAVELSETVIPASHKLTKVEAKDATCAENGNKAYWTCEHCKKYFLSDDTNPETAKAVELSETILPAIQHKNAELRNASEPTETSPGYSGDLYCPDCDNVVEKGYTYWNEGNQTWKLYEDGTLTISGTGAMKDYDYDNNLSPVYNNSNVKKVVIEDGVTSIGTAAFSGCGLISITIPDSVTSIENHAFAYCSNLTGITIPDSVTSIEIAAFYGCGLTSITIPDSVTRIGDLAFYNCSNLQTISLSCKSSLKKSDFGEQADLVSYTNQHILTKIEAKAATCTEDGNKEYWTCEHCGKYFLSDDTNPETATAVELSETVIPALVQIATTTTPIKCVYGQDMNKIDLRDYVKNTDVVGEVTVKVATGSTLPDGMKLDNGKISGKPAKAYEDGKEVTFTFTAENGNTANLTLLFLVAKADPTVEVAVSGDSHTEGDLVGELELILSENSTKGVVELVSEIKALVAGKNTFTWKFTPEDENNYNTITGTVVVNAQTTTTTTTTTKATTTTTKATTTTKPNKTTTTNATTTTKPSKTTTTKVTTTTKPNKTTTTNATTTTKPSKTTTTKATTTTKPNKTTTTKVTTTTKPSKTTTTNATTTTKPSKTTTTNATTTTKPSKTTTTKATTTTKPSKTTTTNATTTTITTTTNTAIPSYGDVNLDGKVDILDAVFLNKYLATLIQFSDAQMANADCCQDGVLNAQDTTALMQFIILLIDDLPVQPTEK